MPDRSSPRTAGWPSLSMAPPILAAISSMASIRKAVPNAWWPLLEPSVLAAVSDANAIKGCENRVAEARKRAVFIWFSFFELIMTTYLLRI